MILKMGKQKYNCLFFVFGSNRHIFINSINSRIFQNNFLTKIYANTLYYTSMYMCKNYISLYHQLIGVDAAIFFRQQIFMACNIPFKATQQIWLWEKAYDLNRLEGIKFS